MGNYDWKHENWLYIYIGLGANSRAETANGVLKGLCKHVYKVAKSGCVSVLPRAWNNSPTTGRIFMKSDLSFFENMYRKFHVSFITLARIMGALREDKSKFLIVSQVLEWEKL